VLDPRVTVLGTGADYEAGAVPAEAEAPAATPVPSTS
jgi:hypothetical protein